MNFENLLTILNSYNFIQDYAKNYMESIHFVKYVEKMGALCFKTFPAYLEISQENEELMLVGAVSACLGEGEAENVFP